MSLLFLLLLLFHNVYIIDLEISLKCSNSVDLTDRQTQRVTSP